MPLSQNRPVNEQSVRASTASIGATPVAASTVVTKSGLLHRAFAISEGASTGTISVAVSLNGGTTVTTFSFTGGANAVGTIEPATPISVVEGDVITFTPSGGAGATIPGHFYAIIR